MLKSFKVLQILLFQLIFTGIPAPELEKERSMF